MWDSNPQDTAGCEAPLSYAGDHLRDWRGIGYTVPQNSSKLLASLVEEQVMQQVIW